jgi:hypothetical protein
MNTAHIYDWEIVLGKRYPLCKDTDMVPLRPLARQLEVTLSSLSRAAKRALNRNLTTAKVIERGMKSAEASELLPAADLPTVLLMAMPRRRSQRFQAMRHDYRALVWKHPHQSVPTSPEAMRARLGLLERELEISKQQNVKLRIQLSSSGTQLAQKRWKGMLTEERLLEIKMLAEEGESLEKISFLFGKPIPTIKAFLSGKYNSATAQSFYRRYGHPATWPEKEPEIEARKGSGNQPEAF